MVDNKRAFDIPILFIVFKRLDTKQRVFERVKSFRPKKLYLASDGARLSKLGEEEKVRLLRSYLLEHIDWPCELHTKFADENLGCKYNPQNAISWFFEQEPMGIILEDDCVPSDSFFPFCQQLLEKYQNDLRVWGLTGTSVVSNAAKSNYSYYFSEYVQTWGWATWADRWHLHLNMLLDFDVHLNEPLVNTKLNNKEANKQLVQRARISYHDQLDAWDYPWFFSVFANNGLFAVSTKNLIHNIGVGEEATHTVKRKMIPATEITFPLKHPTNMLPNRQWDAIFYKVHYGWLSLSEKCTNINHLKAFIRSKLKNILNIQ